MVAPNVVRLQEEAVGAIRRFMEEQFLHFNAREALEAAGLAEDRAAAQRALAFLHTMGDVLWFGSRPGLRRWVMCEPGWVVDQLRAVIHHGDDLVMLLDVPRLLGLEERTVDAPTAGGYESNHSGELVDSSV